MNISDLSPETQHAIWEMAVTHHVTVEQVIDRFYQIFRRRPVSRHGKDTESSNDYSLMANDNPSHTPLFS